MVRDPRPIALGRRFARCNGLVRQIVVAADEPAVRRAPCLVRVARRERGIRAEPHRQHEKTVWRTTHRQAHFLNRRLGVEAVLMPQSLARRHASEIHRRHHQRHALGEVRAGEAHIAVGAAHPLVEDRWRLHAVKEDARIAVLHLHLGGMFRVGGEPAREVVRRHHVAVVRTRVQERLPRRIFAHGLHRRRHQLDAPRPPEAPGRRTRHRDRRHRLLPFRQRIGVGAFHGIRAGRGVGHPGHLLEPADCQTRTAFGQTRLMAHRPHPQLAARELEVVRAGRHGGKRLGLHGGRQRKRLFRTYPHGTHVVCLYDLKRLVAIQIHNRNRTGPTAGPCHRKRLDPLLQRRRPQRLCRRRYDISRAAVVLPPGRLGKGRNCAEQRTPQGGLR